MQAHKAEHIERRRALLYSDMAHYVLIEVHYGGHLLTEPNYKYEEGIVDVVSYGDDEAEQSLHVAFCVVRCLVRKRFLIAGGSAPEIELSMQLSAWAKMLHGMEGYRVRGFAEALEVIPYTQAENAGSNPIAIVTELRNRHVKCCNYVRKGQMTNILEEKVVQPLKF